MISIPNFRPCQHGTIAVRTRAVIALGLGLLVAGCGAGTSLGNLLGEEQKPLGGQREAVNAQSGVLAPDPELLTQPNPIPQARQNANWAQSGGTLTHAMGNLSVSQQPRQVWAVETGKGSSDEGRLTAQPIVAAGRIYVIDTQSTVTAFATSSGQRVWSVSMKPKDEESGGGVGGGLAYEGGRLYVTTTFGEIAALDAASGSIAWRKRLEVPVRAAPTVTAGKIFVAAVNNQVEALSTADGSNIWLAQGVGEQASRAASTSAAVSGNTLVVPLTTGEIAAFDIATGLTNWSDALSGSTRFSGASVLTDISARPVIDDGRVYGIAHAGSMGAFDLNSGEVLWNLSVSGTETPWSAGGYLYTIVHSNVLTAISKIKGRPRWSHTLSQSGSWTGPVMGGGNLIAASDKGSVVFVSPETGRPVNTIDLGTPIFISPIIAGNTIYVLTDDARLIALR